MDFELTNEQNLFRRTLREFVDREIRPVARELGTPVGIQPRSSRP